jgi:hypothetical protein
MKRRDLSAAILAAICALLLATGQGVCAGATATESSETAGYSPYANNNYPTRVLWGDTHLHTNLSLDARAGGARLGPEEAFRLARGEEVVSSHGQPVKLSRPLDFLAVADHSDGMGGMNEILKGNPELLKDPTISGWYEEITQGGAAARKAIVKIVQTFTAGETPEILLSTSFASTIWGRYLETAERFNDPGKFTALIGYEWTSTTGGNNLHRNVYYRDDMAHAAQVLPYTVAASDNPEDLWRWMENYEQHTGGQVIAMAHNGNLSNGLMFPEINPATGKPLTREYAEQRNRWEPVYEVTQIKGDGESHPYLSPDDDFSDYGTWDSGNLGPVLKKPEMLQHEYAREALKKGLLLEKELGVNPYKFGMLGSTDSHTGLATAEEENFFGKISFTEPNPKRLGTELTHFDKNVWMNWSQLASGYAGVWATENTREAIFDAIKRKEVYATTGTRMTVWFFGGWGFNAEDARARIPGEVGYRKGVPMGGDLAAAPAGKAPTFLVAAVKDPYSGNLDRIQIVKGWLDKKGELHEKVYNVLWSDGRKLDSKGKLPPVGNTVDIRNATWTNSIGAADLFGTWEDPDFDREQSAFYYARVLEIPTPFWTAYDAKHFKLDMPKEAPKVNQERAYTSPIWYTPRRLSDNE